MKKLAIIVLCASFVGGLSVNALEINGLGQGLVDALSGEVRPVAEKALETSLGTGVAVAPIAQAATEAVLEGLVAPYLDPNTKRIDFSGMVTALQAAQVNPAQIRTDLRKKVVDALSAQGVIDADKVAKDILSDDLIDKLIESTRRIAEQYNTLAASTQSGVDTTLEQVVQRRITRGGNPNEIVDGIFTELQGMDRFKDVEPTVLGDAVKVAIGTLGLSEEAFTALSQEIE